MKKFACIFFISFFLPFAFAEFNKLEFTQKLSDTRNYCIDNTRGKEYSLENFEARLKMLKKLQVEYEGVEFAQNQIGPIIKSIEDAINEKHRDSDKRKVFNNNKIAKDLLRKASSIFSFEGNGLKPIQLNNKVLGSEISHAVNYKIFIDSSNAKDFLFKESKLDYTGVESKIIDKINLVKEFSNDFLKLEGSFVTDTEGKNERMLLDFYKKKYKVFENIDFKIKKEYFMKALKEAFKARVEKFIEAQVLDELKRGYAEKNIIISKAGINVKLDDFMYCSFHAFKGQGIQVECSAPKGYDKTVGFGTLVGSGYYTYNKGWHYYGDKSEIKNAIYFKGKDIMDVYCNVIEYGLDGLEK